MMHQSFEPKIKTIIAFFIVAAFSFIAGWRDWGADRDNYVAAYIGIIDGGSFGEKLFFAKDLMLLFLVSISSYINDDPKLSFVIICTIALYSKFFAMRRIIGNRILFFIVLYILFISPGLEFAAMRAGLAIGFLMLMLVYSDGLISRFAWPFFAIISHTSLIPIIVAAHPKFQKIFTRRPVLYLFIGILAPLGIPIALSFFQKWSYYEESPSTIYALLMPFFTLLAAIEIFRQRNCQLQHDDDADFFYFRTRHLVALLISISFGIATIIPAASTRYLEIAWCLMLVISIMENRIIGLLLLLILLSYINISRLTWIAAIDPSVTS